MGKKLALIGRRFNALEVIGETDQRHKGGTVIWECVCHQCKQTVYKPSSALTRNPINCGCTNRVDITNMRSGKLIAICPTDKKKNDNIYWECLCDCGNVKLVLATNMIKREVKSCGCLSSGRSAELEGRRFGRLVVKEKLEKRNERGRVIWRCQCDCGQETEASSDILISKGKQSCGCLRDEILQSAYAVVDGTSPYKYINPKPTVRNTTGVLGVSKTKNGSYLATMHFQGKSVLSKTFTSLEEAAAARKQCEEEYYIPLLRKMGLRYGDNNLMEE